MTYYFDEKVMMIISGKTLIDPLMRVTQSQSPMHEARTMARRFCFGPCDCFEVEAVARIPMQLCLISATWAWAVAREEP